MAVAEGDSLRRRRRNDDSVRAREDGAGTRSRTRDPLITNQMLYQLSYTGGNNPQHSPTNKPLFLLRLIKIA